MNVPAKIPVQQAAMAPTRPAVGMFGSLQREIDRLFDDFSPAMSLVRGPAEVRCKMDLAETKDGLELTVELPGLEEKDIEVKAADGMLTISGEKKFETERTDKNYYFAERGYGAFSRSVDLPPGVMTDQIKATLDKGVLKVMIPTPAKPEAKKIEVTTAH